MKRFNTFAVTSLVFVLTVMSGGVARAGVVFSESFESPVVSTFPGTNGNWLNYGTTTPGQTGSSVSRGLSFVGDSGQTWTVDSGNIDITNQNEWVAQQGVQSIDMNGFEPGSIFTSVSLSPGSYELSLYLSKHVALSGDGTLNVEWDGSSVGSSPFTANWSTSLSLPRFRRHVRSHESAVGVCHVETRETILHEGVQG